MTSIEPGWYKDPAEPTTQRYWDGEGWVGDPIPAGATPPPGAPPPAAARTATDERTSDATRQRGSAPQPALPAPPALRGPQPPGSQQPGPGPQHPGTYWPPPQGAQWPPPGTQLPPGTQPPPGWPAGYPIHPAYARRFTPPPRPHGYPLADIGRRLVARIIDLVMLLVINAVVNGWFIYHLYLEVWPWYRMVLHRVQAKLPYDDLPQPQNADRLAFIITLLAAGLWLAYEVPGLANRGQTLGKRLLGIKVMPIEADSALGFGRALKRWNPLGVATLLWIIGVGLIFQAGMTTLIWTSMVGSVLLFVDSLFGAVDQPLHQSLRDKSAATVVVDVKHEQTGEKK